MALILTGTAGASTLDSSTGLAIATWTTGTRPSSPVSGQMGYNTTTGQLEIYNATYTTWSNAGTAPFYSIEYLVVAGGGGGGYDVGGGGGAGGYLASSVVVSRGTAYTITVGAGGTGSGVSGVNGTNGVNSTAFSVTATGGGGGGSYNGGSGSSGGSGGGGSGYGLTTSGGAGTSGQGFAGGNSVSAFGTSATGGGGGGASSVGAVSANNISGFANGGSGTAWSNGTTYAAGGKGAGDLWSGMQDGAANTGNGADGGGNPNTGKNGGSGIVIVRYFGSQQGTGGTVTSSGGYTYHTFTTSGTYTA